MHSYAGTFLYHLGEDAPLIAIGVVVSHVHQIFCNENLYQNVIRTGNNYFKFK